MGCFHVLAMNWLLVNNAVQSPLTGTSVTKQIMIIKQLIKNFTDACKEKGYTMYYNNECGVDKDIFDWMPDAEVTDTKIPTGDFTKVDTKNGITEEVMFKTAITLDLSQAIIKFTEMIKDGGFDKSETYRIIFLNETRNGVPLELVCDRNSGGMLVLHVREVLPDRRWGDADDAWFSSNETSDTEIKTLETLDTLSLEKAIQICKDNGLKVVKTITQEIEM